MDGKFDDVPKAEDDDAHTGRLKRLVSGQTTGRDIKNEVLVGGVPTPTKPKTSKLGAEKLMPDEQRRRFEELAREAGCDAGSDARFDAAVKRLGRAGKSSKS